jgi:hypothetical protein
MQNAYTNDHSGRSTSQAALGSVTRKVKEYFSARIRGPYDTNDQASHPSPSSLSERTRNTCSNQCHNSARRPTAAPDLNKPLPLFDPDENNATEYKPMFRRHENGQENSAERSRERNVSSRSEAGGRTREPSLRRVPKSEDLRRRDIYHSSTSAAATPNSSAEPTRTATPALEMEQATPPSGRSHVKPSYPSLAASSAESSRPGSEALSTATSTRPTPTTPSSRTSVIISSRPPAAASRTPAQKKHKRSGASSPIPERLNTYMATSADLLDSTRRSIANTVRHSAMAAIKTLGGLADDDTSGDSDSDSDSDESFCCVGVPDKPTKTLHFSNRGSAELRARRHSAPGEDLWNHQDLAHCRLCKAKASSTRAGLCRACITEYEANGHVNLSSRATEPEVRSEPEPARKPVRTASIDYSDIAPPAPLRIVKVGSAPCPVGGAAQRRFSQHASVEEATPTAASSSTDWDEIWREAGVDVGLDAVLPRPLGLKGTFGEGSGAGRVVGARPRSRGYYDFYGEVLSEHVVAQMQEEKRRAVGSQRRR